MSKKDLGFWAIVKREYGRMHSRRIYGLSMVLAPLFCFIFFTTLMKEGLPESLPRASRQVWSMKTTRRCQGLY